MNGTPIHKPLCLHSIVFIYLSSDYVVNRWQYATIGSDYLAEIQSYANINDTKSFYGAQMGVHWPSNLS